MKISVFLSSKLFLIACLIMGTIGLFTFCNTKTEPFTVAPVDNKPVLTAEEDLAAKGYQYSSLMTLSKADKALVELAGLQVEISGPDSQWGTKPPTFLLATSTNDGVDWQTNTLEHKQMPLYLGSYAFYYGDNKIINSKDVGTIIVYCKP
ncbi:MAG: hypothetical protein WCO55_03725 [Candidatus Falkowbacteria bacterium]